MRIALIISIKDEAPYIIDWIAHHRAIGVTDFVFFQNDSVDGSDLILSALRDEGLIEYHDNSDPQSAPRARKLPAQRRAYAWAMTLDSVKSADFVMPLDIDEYLDVPGADLPTFIDRLGGDAISLPWRLFGSNGAQQFERAPVTKRFEMAADTKATGKTRAFTQVKTLFRPKLASSVNLHMPKLDPSAKWIIPTGEDARATLGSDNFIPSPDFSAGFIRHYHVKSMAEFCAKIVRGFASHETGKVPQICIPMFHEMDQNTEHAPIAESLFKSSQNFAQEIRDTGSIAPAEDFAITEFERLCARSIEAVKRHPALHSGTYKNRAAFDAYFQEQVYDKLK